MVQDFLQYMLDQTGKTTAIDRTAGVSRHHWVPIEGHLKPLGQSQHYLIEGFEKEALNYSPITPITPTN